MPALAGSKTVGTAAHPQAAASTAANTHQRPVKHPMAILTSKGHANNTPRKQRTRLFHPQTIHL